MGQKSPFSSAFQSGSTLTVGLILFDHFIPPMWPNIWYSNSFSIYVTIWTQWGRVWNVTFSLISWFQDWVTLLSQGTEQPQNLFDMKYGDYPIRQGLMSGWSTKLKKIFFLTQAFNCIILEYCAPWQGRPTQERKGNIHIWRPRWVEWGPQERSNEVTEVARVL